jgi:hypothetical protein
MFRLWNAVGGIIIFGKKFGRINLKQHTTFELPIQNWHLYSKKNDY